MEPWAARRALRGSGGPTGLNPTNITVYNGEVLFSGLDASGDMNLWVSDGTAGGTHELIGVVGADATGLAPSDLTVYNGEVLFRGLDHRAARSSGHERTAAGTHELTGIVGAATTGAGLDPSGFTVYDGTVLFSASIRRPPWIVENERHGRRDNGNSSQLRDCVAWAISG